MVVLLNYTLQLNVQVLENPNINADPRNQAISAAADGVPFFKDRNAANGWPVVLYPENGPVGVASTNEDAHMVGMAPSEYWDEIDGKKVLVKKYTLLCYYTRMICILLRDAYLARLLVHYITFRALLVRFSEYFTV
jgi:hypothetical protein